MVDLYSILSSKSNNVHYLKRYIKFIKYCIEINKNLDKSIYTEEHHIAPRAKDLFPEFKDFNIHKWNQVTLTARQHLIAHVILWKTYKGSQSTALNCMLSMQNHIRFNHVMPSLCIIKFAIKARIDANFQRKGKSVYKDDNGIKFYLHYTDPKIKELNLVGHSHGSKHSSNRKRLISISKIGLVIWNDGIIDKYFKSDDNPGEGWVKGSIILKNCHAGLMWNDGITHKYFPNSIDPGEGWIRGRIKSSESVWWNDGVNNKQFHKNIIPDVSWNLGRVNKGKMSWWNDGVNDKLFSKDNDSYDGWTKGRIYKNELTKR